MSTIEHEQQDPKAAERPFLVRAFEATLTPGDGRTVDVRVVPYGQPATVSDGGPVYREEFVEGCFDDQLRAANRVDVLLNFEHQAGISGLVGRGVALRSVPRDGLHGSFRIFETQDGDKVLELVREGVLSGVSLEAYPKKSVRTAEGLVRRVKAHLDKVALCRRPAYAGAEVLALREEPETIFDEELLPVDTDPELIERCRRLGLKLPQRYTEAHPE
jgi:HK97 family phage prohead protease